MRITLVKRSSPFVLLCNTISMQLLLKKIHSENNKYSTSKQCNCMRIHENDITYFEMFWNRTYLETHIPKVFWIMLE